MSGVWAVVPAKPLSQAKSRLATALGHDDRLILAKGLLVRTLKALATHDRIARACVVSSSTAVLRLGLESGAMPIREPRRSAGLNGALDLASGKARRGGAEALLVLPADLPLLAAADIDSLVRALPDAGPALIMASDRHGSGTNALLARPPGLIGHHFGEGSFEAHRRAARTLSVACVVVDTPGLAVDIDSPADLELVPPGLLAGLTRRACERG